MLAVCLVLAWPGLAADGRLRILALGDSLVAGHGLPEPQGFTSQLAAALADAGVDAQVINGGVSGDTTAGGRARLDWILEDDPDIVILELGANDGLRGIDPAETEANLDAILARLTRERRAVLFAGMLAPPNLGPEFGAAFNALFPRLADRYPVDFYPFFLDGVARDPTLTQDDGLHPNAAGVGVIVGRLVPYLLRVIDGVRHSSAGASAG